MNRHIPVVTLTTDFGADSPYVAEMKGVLLGALGQVQLVDVTHSVSPQDREQAAWEIAQVVDAFPPDTLHIVVVDPGVGTARAIVAGAIGNQRFIGPDNGVLSVVLERAEGQWTLHQLTESRYWRPLVSSTFHGRDIMASVAGHWLQGVPLSEFGPPISQPVRLADLWPSVDERAGERRVVGRVVRADRFGNLITNIPYGVPPWNVLRPARVTLADGRSWPLLNTYGDVSPGEALALVGSGGWIELAVHGGNAQHQLALGRGVVVAVS